MVKRAIPHRSSFLATNGTLSTKQVTLPPGSRLKALQMSPNTAGYYTGNIIMVTVSTGLASLNIQLATGVFSHFASSGKREELQWVGDLPAPLEGDTYIQFEVRNDTGTDCTIQTCAEWELEV